MSGYTKLFGSILESSVWLERPPIKVVWITLLAMADRDGAVEASLPGLARRANVPRRQCEQALAIFLGPDPDSRTPDHEGRRITVIPGGWRLLNYEMYRHRASKEEAQAKATARQQRYRARHALSRAVTAVTLNDAIAPAPAPAPAPAEKKTKNAAAVNARSKRPIFSGQRFVVFDWQLEDLRRILGPLTDDFDLHEFFFNLDALAANNGQVIPQRDGGQWLQAQLIAEAQRRGLKVARSAAPSSAAHNRVGARPLGDTGDPL